MAVIIDPIPNQAFEIIRDRIADILLEELDNQVINYYDMDLDVDVYIERYIPFNHTDAPCVNVTLEKGAYDNETSISSDGTYNFSIDAYTKAKTSADGRGDQRSGIKLQRLLGACRAILKNPKYKTLGFTPGFIGRVSVGEILIAGTGKQDAEMVMMGRLSLTVRAIETVELTVPNLIDGYTTRIKINDGDQGYKYSNIAESAHTFWEDVTANWEDITTNWEDV